MLYDVVAGRDAPLDILRVTEDLVAGPVSFSRCQRVRPVGILVMCREVRDIGLLREPCLHDAADLGRRVVVPERRPVRAVIKARAGQRRVAVRALLTVEFGQRNHGSDTVIDKQLAHPVEPVHMRVDQSRDDVLAIQPEMLCVGWQPRAGAEDVADRVTVDDNCVTLERRVGDPVDDRCAGDDERRTVVLRQARRAHGDRQQGRQQCSDDVGTRAHVDHILASGIRITRV